MRANTPALYKDGGSLPKVVERPRVARNAVVLGSCAESSNLGGALETDRAPLSSPFLLQAAYFHSQSAFLTNVTCNIHNTPHSLTLILWHPITPSNALLLRSADSVTSLLHAQYPRAATLSFRYPLHSVSANTRKSKG